MARRFKWRLESVKKAKDREEERRQEALSRAQETLRTEEARLAELRARREEVLGQLRQKRSGRLNAADLALSHTYLKELEEKIRSQAQQVEEARSLSEQKRAHLLETVKERKILENLKERDRQKFRREEQRREQATMDEAAVRRAFRNQGE